MSDVRSARMALDQARAAVARIRVLEDAAQALFDQYADGADPPPEAKDQMFQIVYSMGEAGSDLADAHEILDAACELQERQVGSWLGRLFGR